MTYRIEYDIPIPPKRTARTGGRTSRSYPFAKMRAPRGRRKASFFVPRGNAHKIFCAVCQFRNRHRSKARFIVRKVARGARCWRIK